MQTYVIVGAGQAGAWLARTLRKADEQARIVLIGDESEAPYERPPLSKEVLKGEAPPASTTVLTRDAAREMDVALWLGETVTRIDRGNKQVECDSGRSIAYSRLFLATGSRVRRLPLPDIPEDRVCYLRTRADAECLRETLDQHDRVLVIGGGWIGLEVASAVHAMGKSVSVIEMAPRLCARAVPSVVSDYLYDLHANNGIDVHVDTRMTLSRDGTTIRAVPDKAGEPVEADMVVVAIGIVPNVELAEACGLAVDNGIVVDEYGRTSDPDIFAAGDVTNHPSRHSGTRERLESWDNAQNQAIAVAHAAIDPVEPYADIPWFWSDQHGVNVQILGLPPEGVEPQKRGDPDNGKGLWLFWQGREVRSIIAVNAPREIRVVKKWMQKGQYPTPEAVADESIKLQKLPIQ